MALSSLFIKMSFYYEEINGIVTKVDTEVPNNLDEILFYVKELLFCNNDFLYVRFYYSGSCYQVNNKNFKIKDL